jgi:putative membrane protein
VPLARARTDAAVPAGPPREGLEVVAVVATAAAVLAQVAYPLLAGTVLRTATIAAVLAFAVASVASAAAWHGLRAGGLLLLAAAGLGLVAEAVGVASGWPFGTYRYAGTLGPQLLGVPLLVPLAWTMMAYPALLAARRLAPAGAGSRRVAVALLGGVTLAAWDLYLDPQMVAAGHWSWAYPAPSLPGIPDVPLTNTAGWLLVGTLLTALLDALLPASPKPAAETLPAALLTWTWLGSLLANVAFFGRPAVGALGGVAMALVVVPYLRRLRTAWRAS